MKTVKPGRFVKYKNFIVRCSKEDTNACQNCTDEWLRLGCVNPCQRLPGGICIKAFDYNHYPRPVKGQDYSSLKFRRP